MVWLCVKLKSGLQWKLFFCKLLKGKSLVGFTVEREFRVGITSTLVFTSGPKRRQEAEHYRKLYYSYKHIITRIHKGHK